MAKMTNREFMAEVSKRTNLRRDIVEDVFQSAVDIAIEQIVNTGEFTMKDLFTVTSKNYKGYSLAGTEVPPQKRLAIRLSARIKSFWKLKNSRYPDSEFSRNEWEEASRFHKKSEASTPIPKKREVTPPRIPTFAPKPIIPATPHIPANDFNPLLDEDD